jgi:hypothetical protein
MGLLDRLSRGSAPRSTKDRPSLATDAAAMRETLDGLRRENGGGGLDLRAVLRDLLEGEVEAPTADVADLRERDVDPDDFFAREVAPSWEGLNEAQRAARLDGFMEMCSMLEGAGDMAGVPAEMGARVRTKTLLLAWSFDEEYGYLSRLARGESPAD